MTTPSGWKCITDFSPGLTADSLPDAWGDRMLTVEAPGLQTVLGKLAAIGQRGPGALTFEPVIGAGADTSGVLSDLATLAREASQISGWPKATEAAGLPKDSREAWLANMETQNRELRADFARKPTRSRTRSKPPE